MTRRLQSCPAGRKLLKDSRCALLPITFLLLRRPLGLFGRGPSAGYPRGVATASGAGSAIPVVLCIDVEPDDHVYPLTAPSPWSGFEALLAGAPRLRQRLSDATGRPANLNWDFRFDPQIELAYGSPTYVVDRYGDDIERLSAQGDAIGTHPHAWRWDADRQRWIADHRTRTGSSTASGWRSSPTARASDGPRIQPNRRRVHEHPHDEPPRGARGARRPDPRARRAARERQRGVRGVVDR